MTGLLSLFDKYMRRDILDAKSHRPLKFLTFKLNLPNIGKPFSEQAREKVGIKGAKPRILRLVQRPAKNTRLNHLTFFSPTGMTKFFVTEGKKLGHATIHDIE